MVVTLEDTTRERYDDLIRIYITPTFGSMPAAKLDAGCCVGQVDLRTREGDPRGQCPVAALDGSTRCPTRRTSDPDSTRGPSRRPPTCTVLLDRLHPTGPLAHDSSISQAPMVTVCEGARKFERDAKRV